MRARLSQSRGIDRSISWISRSACTTGAARSTALVKIRSNRRGEPRRRILWSQLAVDVPRGGGYRAARGTTLKIVRCRCSTKPVSFRLGESRRSYKGRVCAHGNEPARERERERESERARARERAKERERELEGGGAGAAGTGTAAACGRSEIYGKRIYTRSHPRERLFLSLFFVSSLFISAIPCYPSISTSTELNALRNRWDRVEEGRREIPAEF